jgi:predicted Rossmann-fold nucleotide-binding protein
VARLTRYLTGQGFMIVSGGGPGAMEAAHLGSTFAGSNEADFAAALNLVAKVPDLPALDDLITKDGQIAPGHEKAFDAAQLWINAALNAKKLAPKEPKLSLAIPTWLYGSEPTTPFATHYAKYFQNSIREEALITNSRAGIVYAKGSGGTVREIFEDAERNYYVPDVSAFTPMVFYDNDRYWERDAEFDKNGNVARPGIKLDETVKKLFTFARAKKRDADECLKKVKFTVDEREIGELLHLHSGVAQRNLMFALLDDPLQISTAVLSRD